MKSKRTTIDQVLAKLNAVEEVPSALRQYLTEREVTREYPFSPGLLRKWRRVGGGPAFVRVNRSIFYARSALELFMATHQVVN